MFRTLRPMQFVCPAALAMLVIGFVDEAQAQTTAIMGVTFEKTGSCTISTNHLVFGSANEAFAVLTVDCQAGLAFQIGIGPGSQSVVNTTRRMLGADGTSHLPYKIYKDASRTQEWGDATCGGPSCGSLATIPGTAYSGTGTGSFESIPVYGQVVPPAGLPAQAYTDTVTVAIAF